MLAEILAGAEDDDAGVGSTVIVSGAVTVLLYMTLDETLEVRELEVLLWIDPVPVAETSVSSDTDEDDVVDMLELEIELELEVAGHAVSLPYWRR